jgi:hypothetical protein
MPQLFHNRGVSVPCPGTLDYPSNALFGPAICPNSPHIATYLCLKTYSNTGFRIFKIANFSLVFMRVVEGKWNLPAPTPLNTLFWFHFSSG